MIKFSNIVRIVQGDTVRSTEIENRKSRKELVDQQVVVKLIVTKQNLT